MTTADRFDLSGDVVLVTGGARGIGRALAIGFARAGADLALVDHPQTAGLEGVADEIRILGRRVWTYEQDLARTEALAGLADHIWDEIGAVDVLVNNAAVARLERFNEITPEAWREVMSVNLDAPFFLTQRVTEHMIAQEIGGRVLMVSSKNGIVAEAGLAHYNASKGGLELLTQSLAVELGAHGITVNAISPGVIETGIADEFDLERAAFETYYQEHIPLEQRFGDVDELLGAALLLVSEAGSYITGQHIVIDGGVLANQLPRMQFMTPYVNTVR